MFHSAPSQYPVTKATLPLYYSSLLFGTCRVLLVFSDPLEKSWVLSVYSHQVKNHMVPWTWGRPDVQRLPMLLPNPTQLVIPIL